MTICFRGVRGEISLKKKVRQTEANIEKHFFEKGWRVRNKWKRRASEYIGIQFCYFTRRRPAPQGNLRRYLRHRMTIMVSLIFLLKINKFHKLLKLHSASDKSFK